MASLRSVCVASALALSVAAQVQPFPKLMDMKLEDIQYGLEQECFSSVNLVEMRHFASLYPPPEATTNLNLKAYIKRIDEVNPKLHAVTEVNPDALEIARELDQERAQNKTRGPLHGVPILLKNNLATMDRMNTTAGSYALLGATVPRDSTIARNLRDAGAIILGKSNLSQWSYFRSLDLPSGWSSHGSQVYGAYHENQDPNGSSSGSGVAADLALAFAAIGTETVSSLLGPAHRNNLVGIKPTVGLTSRSLMIPISEHLDTVGPMARSVRDAAYILQAIAGQDSNDNYTSAIPNIPDYVKACQQDALRGSRIGVPWNIIEQLPDSQLPEAKAFQDSIKVLQEAGATIVDVNMTLPSDLSDVATMVKIDFKTNIAEYLSQLSSNPNGLTDLSELREFTKQNPVEKYPDFSLALWDETLDDLGYGNKDPGFWDLYQSITTKGESAGIQAVLEDAANSLTAVVMPTHLAPIYLAYNGAPAVTVPMGYYPASATITKSPGDLVDTGPSVPFGFSFVGRRWSEAGLIGLAYGFEQRMLVRDRAKRIVSPKSEMALPATCQIMQ